MDSRLTGVPTDAGKRLVRLITRLASFRGRAATALMLLVLTPGTSLAATTAWTRQFGTADTHTGWGIAYDSGGFTVVGSTLGRLAGSAGMEDAYIRRYSPTGTLLWTRQFGTGGQEQAIDVAADADGLTVIGQTDGRMAGTVTPTPGVRDIFVRRYSRTGSVLWTRQFGSKLDEDAAAIAADSAGITVVGTTYGSFAGSLRGESDAFIRRYTFSGSVLWTRQFGTVEGDTGHDVVADANGITVGGGTDGDLGGRNAGLYTDAFVRRYDRSGRIVWTRQFGQRGDDWVDALAVDASGITVGGPTWAQPYDGYASQAYVRRYSLAGALLWDRKFGNTDLDESATGVAADAAGITVTGYTAVALDGPHKGSADVFVRRYDRAGNLTWRTQFGSAERDIATDATSGARGFAIIGNTPGAISGTNKGDVDVFVRKFDL